MVSKYFWTVWAIATRLIPNVRAFNVAHETIQHHIFYHQKFIHSLLKLRRITSGFYWVAICWKKTPQPKLLSDHLSYTLLTLTHSASFFFIGTTTTDPKKIIPRFSITRPRLFHRYFGTLQWWSDLTKYLELISWQFDWSVRLTKKSGRAVR